MRNWGNAIDTRTFARTAARASRVLVVDDDASIRECLALALEIEGHAVAQAEDGLDALLALRCGPRPDVIVLDLEMPVMTGWEFREAQLRDPELAAIPVVVVSSATGLAVHADARLAKPFRMEELLEVIDALAARRSGEVH
jgi:CheY-like chemotaxis protein